MVGETLLNTQPELMRPAGDDWLNWFYGVFFLALGLLFLQISPLANMILLSQLLIAMIFIAFTDTPLAAQHLRYLRNTLIAPLIIFTLFYISLIYKAVGTLAVPMDEIGGYMLALILGHFVLHWIISWVTLFWLMYRGIKGFLNWRRGYLP